MSALGGAVSRAALISQLNLHAAVGGVLEGVTILPEPPHSYADLYGASRGTLDLIWLDEFTADVDTTGFGQSLELTERATHTLAIQVDRATEAGTQAVVDARADALLEYVYGIICGDQTLGLTLATEGFRHFLAQPTGHSFRRRILDAGGREPGHSCAYVVNVSISVSAAFSAPALP